MTTTAQIEHTERAGIADEPAPRLFTASEFRAMRDAGILGERERIKLIDGKLLDAYSNKPRLFNVKDFHAMDEAIIFGPEERLELMNGVIIVMPQVRKWHRSSVFALGHLMTNQVGNRALVGVQSVIRLDDNRELFPDIAILEFSEDFYYSAPPMPSDIRLIVEVSDSSLRYDLRDKLPAYAEAGVPETWIANIPARRVEVYTDPVGGIYLTRRVFHPGESVSPPGFPDVSIPVDLMVPA